MEAQNKNTQTAQEPTEAEPQDASQDGAIEPLITLASALLDIDRVRIIAALAARPANRIDMATATGISNRDLLRQLGILEEAGLVKPEEPVRQPDAYTPYVINMEAFRAARQAMGKYKGVKKRPSDSREMTLATFMPGGKLAFMPHKQEQIVTILTELARKFEPDRQYTEREVNVILTEANEDYASLRRYLVDYGFMARSDGIYIKKT